MSLYIGKDDNNDAIMHITTGSKTKNELTSLTPDLSSAIFHSKCAYLFSKYEKYTMTAQTGSMCEGNYVTISKSSSYMIGPSGNLRTTLVFVNGEYVNMYVNAPFVSFALGYYYDSDSEQLVIYLNDLSGSVTIQLLFTDYFGLTYNSSNIDYYGAPIIVNNYELSFNGFNYFDNQWVVTPPINDSDDILSIQGKQYQIINSTSTSGGFSLDTSNGTVKIYKGSKCLVDSSIAGFKPFMPDTQIGIKTETKSLYLHRSSGSNAPGNYDNAAVSFSTFIPYTDRLALLNVCIGTSTTTNTLIVNFKQDFDWITFGVGFVPANIRVGYCNIRFGVKFYQNNLYLSVTGGNCCSNTNDAYPFLVNSNSYFEFIYI